MLRGAGQQESNRITQGQKRRAQSREKAVVWGRTGSKNGLGLALLSLSS